MLRHDLYTYISVPQKNCAVHSKLIKDIDLSDEKNVDIEDAFTNKVGSEY